MSAVLATGLAKTYGDAPALGPVDLDIAAGQRVALLGHNGSGKTTLLRLTAGLLDATAGTVTVLGHPAGSLEARAFTSYLGDQPVFYDDLTVWEHLEYIAKLHGTDGWEQHAADLLDHPRAHRPRRPPADDVQPRAAPEGGDRHRLRPAVRGAPRRRAVRRARPTRARGAARSVRPRPRRRGHARRRDPRARRRQRRRAGRSPSATVR